MELKDSEKIDKYLDLTREIKKLRNCDKNGSWILLNSLKVAGKKTEWT